MINPNGTVSYSPGFSVFNWAEQRRKSGSEATSFQFEDEVEMVDATTSWADLLAYEVRRMEAKANGFDPALGTEAWAPLAGAPGI